MLYLSIGQLKGLPGLPQSDRGLRDYLLTLPQRPRRGRGGGIEYLAEALPELTQQAIAHREAVNSFPFEIKSNYGCPDPILRAEGILADARAWYVSALSDFRATHDLCATTARKYFLKGIEFGLISIPSNVADVVSRVSETTLRRWQSLLKTDGIDRLNGRWQGRKSIVPEQVVESVPHLLCHSARKIEEWLRLALKGIVIPSARTISRIKERFKKSQPGEWLRSIEGEKSYKNKFKGREGSRSEGVTRPNQRWELDGTKTNVLLSVLLNDGKRYWIVAAIDVYTRRTIVYLSPDNNSRAILNGLLAKAIERFGIPEAVRIDNGSEYANNFFDTVCDQLGIEIERCNPGCPEEKPHIERFFGTMTRDFETAQAGFVGANTTQRQAWLDSVATLSPQEFAEKLDRWVDYYNNRRHSSIKQTPNERWSSGVASGVSIRRVADPDLLRLLILEPVKGTTRQIQPKGISVNGNWYFALDGEYERRRLQNVVVKRDPLWMDRVYCFDLKGGRYLFIAICPELSGQTRGEFISALKAQRKVCRKYKQAVAEVSEFTQTSIQPIERKIYADLPALEQSAILRKDLDRLVAPATLQVVESLPDREPLDPLDRYCWMRRRYHEGESVDLDFLRRIESDRFAWDEAIDCDLLYIVPTGLSRPWDYIAEYQERGHSIGGNHPSIQWRSYRAIVCKSQRSAAEIEYCERFEAENPILSDRLRSIAEDWDITIDLATA